MIRSSQLAKFAAPVLLTLGALSLSACSPSSAPNPTPTKVLTACRAVNNC
jgi:hypothetical protein